MLYIRRRKLLRLTEYPSDGDFVIAADAGLKHCTEAWVAPAPDSRRLRLPRRSAEGGDVLQLPVEKDDTDTIYAMRVGLERGYTDFVVYGGTGRQPCRPHDRKPSGAAVPLLARGALPHVRRRRGLERAAQREGLFPRRLRRHAVSVLHGRRCARRDHPRAQI